MSDFAPAAIPDGKIEIDGQIYRADAKGGLLPEALVKPQHLLQDEVVRKIVGYALALSEQIARFKAHTFEDISGFEALLAQEYGAKVGGRKGNVTLSTVDALFQVRVQVADRITFGPELATAKSLLDECLNEWSENTRDELKALISKAFATDREGQVSRTHIFLLLQIESEDARWNRAMDAIRDAMRVVGSAVYCRCYRRPSFDAPWEPIVLDMARA
jgi:hypothetical protein